MEYVKIYRAVVGTGAAGAFAPVNFRQRVHAPVLKKVVELLSNTKVRKSLILNTKLQKLRLITHNFNSRGGFNTQFAKRSIFCTRPVRVPTTPLLLESL